MLREDPGRLLKVNVLHIFGACIDIPSQDHYQGSATLLANILAWRGAESIAPNMFPDAEHLIQSLIDRIDWCAKHNLMDGKDWYLYDAHGKTFLGNGMGGLFQKSGTDR